MTPDRLRQIEEIFHDVRSRSGPERDALLAAACEGDSDLRRNVESLLAHAVTGALDIPMKEVAAQLLSRSDRLESGTALGGYVVEAHIGSGGMGDVYRARDTRLGRNVALKLLPASFTTDPGRVARFSREAQLLASLNHPHIAQIYGLEQSDGRQFLVLELVEGDTLDVIVAGRPLPIEEVLDIASQLAEALEAAHEKGIVHRDLKPANIAVTHDHRVKILDFGLAMAVDPPDEASHQALTGIGVVVGTTAYMAPEQAAGRRVDKRADVWAFGCVLYEMLTGARAFPGGDVQQTLASVMAHTPEWHRLPAATPAAIRRLLRRCLEKEVSRRLRDIGDARIEIADAAAGNGDEALVSSTAGSRRRFGPLALLGAAIAAASVAVGLGRWFRVTIASPAPVQHLSIAFNEGSSIHPSVRHFALSPDGKRLAFVGTNGRLWLRALDEAVARELPGTDNAYTPFFSPDSEWVGYIGGDAWGGGNVARPGKLRKVPVRGGVPIDLTDAAALGASWGRDGTIVFCRRIDEGVALLAIAASGGAPRQITTPPAGNAAFRVAWPSRLPDDTTLLFSETDGATFETGRTVALSLRTGERRVVFEQGYGARYVPSGHLLFAQNGTLMAVPFDPDKLATRGPAAQIVDSVATFRQVGWLGVAASGNLLVFDAGTDPNASETLEWVASNGDTVPVVGDRAPFNFPRLSPDGRRLAVGAGYDIWILDLVRGSRGLIAARDRGNYPAPTITTWTPDSRRLVMNRRNTTDTSLVLVDADDATSSRVLLQRPHFVQVGSWSTAGALAFFQIPGNSARDVWVLDPGAAEPRAFASTQFNERGAVFSPDGRWIVYVADPTGRDEIYLRPYPGPGAPVAVSTSGGTEPTWSRSGREIYYRDGRRMMSVAFTPAPTVTLGRPRVVFDRPFATSNLGVANYDVAPDGRFVMIGSTNSMTRAVELAAVINWSEELKARAPAR